MLKVETPHLEAVLSRKSSRTALCRLLELPADHKFDLSRATQEQIDVLSDALRSLVMDNPEAVKSFDAEQDKGVYPITIYGRVGAYAVHAPEYDWSGLFLTLKEAERHIRGEFGEFLV